MDVLALKHFLVYPRDVHKEAERHVGVDARLVLDEDNLLPAYGEGDVVDPVLKESVLEGVDGDRHVFGQGNVFQRTIQLPEQIRVAEQEGKNAVLEVLVDTHAFIVVRMRQIFNGAT